MLGAFLDFSFNKLPNQGSHIKSPWYNFKLTHPPQFCGRGQHPKLHKKVLLIYCLTCAKFGLIMFTLSQVKGGGVIMGRPV